MPDENKHNIHYFEAPTMRMLFESMQIWQNENNKRFLSLSVENDRGKFSCIALTNPTEVIIKDGWGSGGVGVRDNALLVYSYSLNR